MANHRIKLRHRKPTALRRAELLESQQGCCFYCHCPIGELVQVNGEVRYCAIHWDHVVPWSFSLDNKDSNFVASCPDCNTIKSDKVFNTLTKARTYVRKERINRGLPLFKLPKPIQQETALAEILLFRMPNGALLDKPLRYRPKNPHHPHKPTPNKCLLSDSSA